MNGFDVRTVRRVAALCLVLALPVSAAAEDGATGRTADARQAISARLAAWAEDFNAGRTDGLCDLFSEDLRASVRGEPVRGFEAMCEQFRRSASDRATRMTYAPKVDDVLLLDGGAVASVTWVLRVQRGVVDTQFVERAQYVFRPGPDGDWKVVRLFSYIEPTDR